MCNKVNRLSEWLENFGLPRPWQIYLLVIELQAIVFLLVLLLEFKLSRFGVLMHLMGLGVTVISLRVFSGVIPRYLPWMHYPFVLVICLLPFSLLLTYSLVFIGLEYIGSTLNIELMTSYFGQFGDVLDAIGVSAIWLFTGISFLFIIGFWLSLKVINRHDTWNTEQLVRLTIIVLISVVFYGFTSEQWKHRELFHTVYYGVFRISPIGILKDGRLKPEYGAKKITRIKPRPLVLITIDALRSDAMQIYGGAVPNTPFMNSLYKEGKLQKFENAKSICTTSYCGLIGTLSSRYWSQLDTTPDNLPDVLKEYGYKNYSLLSGDHVRFYGLSRQYGPNIDIYRDSSFDNDGELNDDRNVQTWLKILGEEIPSSSFTHIHLMSVHNIGKKLDRYKMEMADSFSKNEPKSSTSIFDQRKKLSPKAEERIRRYHQGIRQADDSISRIFSWLKTKNWLSDVLVIITADHGEYLGEFGKFGHNGLPYEPAINIPLLVYDPYNQKYPRRSIYSQVDIAPTFLNAINATIPQRWSGIPLQLNTDRCAVNINSYESRGVVGVIGGVPMKYLSAFGDDDYLFDLRNTEIEQTSVDSWGSEGEQIVQKLKSCTQVNHPALE